MEELRARLSPRDWGMLEIEPVPIEELDSFAHELVRRFHLAKGPLAGSDGE
jgi:hypothetical protein